MAAGPQHALSLILDAHQLGGASPRARSDRSRKGLRSIGRITNPLEIILRAVLTPLILILSLCISACGGQPSEPAKAEAPAKVAKATKAEEAPKNVGLEDYELAKGPRKIQGVSNDASGLAYSPKTKTLFLVINGTSEIFELTLDGKAKRRIRTRGFSDLEGIAYVSGDTFAVVEEGRGTLSRITIDEKTTTINYGMAKGVSIDGSRLGNSGIEGLAYDAKGKRFFAVKEKNPRRIYQIAGSKVTNPWDIQKESLEMSDLSGVYYHQESGHLLILSHESRCLVEATVDGKEVSRLSIRGMSQPEGVTMDDEGTIYVCGEPDSFQVYKKKAEK